jgi:hypothetical protein
MSAFKSILPVVCAVGYVIAHAGLTYEHGFEPNMARWYALAAVCGVAHLCSNISAALKREKPANKRKEESR